MTVVWFLLWFLLSAFVVGVFLWSTRVLFQQKKAWQAYAKKYQLSYNKGRFLSSPVVFGDYEGHRINVYSEEQQTEDARGSRFRTVVELMRKSGMRFSGAVASNHLVPVMDLLEIPDHYNYKGEGWSENYGVKTDDLEYMEQYLTQTRFRALERLLKNDAAGFIFVFNPDDLLVRYETGDPIHDPRRLDKLVKTLREISEVLKLGEHEKNLAARKKKRRRDEYEDEDEDEEAGPAENAQPEEQSVSEAPEAIEAEPVQTVEESDAPPPAEDVGGGKKARKSPSKKSPSKKSTDKKSGAERRGA